MASIKQKDLEEISAYLDRALDDRARGRLEARLQSEPELHREMEFLRQTRRALRSTPQFRAPRNFTLTPEMVGDVKPARNTPFSIARFAFALASVFLVFSLVGSYTFGGLPESTADSAVQFESAEEPAVLAMEAPEAESAVQAADEMQIESLEMESAAAADASQAVPVEESQEGGTTDLPAGGGGLPPEPTPEELQAFAPPSDDPQAMVVEESMEETAGDSGDIARSMVVEETPGVEAAELEAPKLPDTKDDKAAAPANIWAIAAWISGTAAVLSGGITLYLRKR